VLHANPITVAILLPEKDVARHVRRGSGVLELRGA